MNINDMGEDELRLAVHELRCKLATVPELEAEVTRLRALFRDVVVMLADELIQADNQLHGIKGAGMGKRTIRDVEKSLRKVAAEAAGGSDGTL